MYNISNVYIHIYLFKCTVIFIFIKDNHLNNCLPPKNFKNLNVGCKMKYASRIMNKNKESSSA